jgi:hypothetical protein
MWRHWMPGSFAVSGLVLVFFSTSGNWRTCLLSRNTVLTSKHVSVKKFAVCCARWRGLAVP